MQTVDYVRENAKTKAIKNIIKFGGFQIDHARLEPGIYVSRKDKVGNQYVTTFDLRFKRPKKDTPIDQRVLYSIERIGNLFLRRISMRREEVLYFGPMACRTGFYLLVKGNLESEDIKDTVTKMCNFIFMYSGSIPEAAGLECDCNLDYDLTDTKFCVIEYLDELRNNFCYKYPA